MPIERINPEGIFRTSAYSHVVKAGNTVYISGQVSTDSEGNLVGPGDCEAQTVQALKKLQICLASVGATFANLVYMCSYLARAEDAAAYRRGRELMGTTDLPASTVVTVAQLGRPEILVEIEVVAYLE